MRMLQVYTKYTIYLCIVAGPKSYEELISRLEVCESRDFADDFAKDFCYINNAPNRKRLIKV